MSLRLKAPEIQILDRMTLRHQSLAPAMVAGEVRCAARRRSWWLQPAQLRSARPLLSRWAGCGRLPLAGQPSAAGPLSATFHRRPTGAPESGTSKYLLSRRGKNRDGRLARRRSTVSYGVSKAYLPTLGNIIFRRSIFFSTYHTHPRVHFCLT